MVTKMQPVFSYGSGINDLTMGQAGFEEIRPNSVRFFTFLSTEWEFLQPVFTTTRYCL